MDVVDGRLATASRSDIKANEPMADDDCVVRLAWRIREASSGVAHTARPFQQLIAFWLSQEAEEIDAIACHRGRVFHETANESVVAPGGDATEVTSIQDSGHG